MSSKIKILLVEHNPDDIELIEHELNNGGFDFALKIVKREKDYVNAINNFIPDIILCDYSLPAFDGPAALKIREEIVADIPFIFVSGSIGEERSIEYIKNGVTDYVLKEKLFTLAVKVKRAIQESNDRKQKKQITNALQQRERQLQIAQQIAHVGSWELDFETNVLIFSDETCKIFGIEASQNHLSFETWSSIVHPEDLDDILKKIKTSRDALIESSYNHRIIRPDGIVRHIYSESRFDLDPSSKPKGMYGITSDVTDKRLAEQKLLVTSDALEAALSDLNKIMDSSLDMICTIDEEGKFVTVSSASAPILGYEPHELKNKKFIDFVFSEDVDYTIETATDVMGGTPVTIFENRYVHKNGNAVPLLWSATWDDADKRMYCIAKDATEKKKFENALEGERQRFEELFSQAPTSMGVLKGPTHIFETANPLYLELTGKTDIIGKTVKEVMPELVDQGFIGILDKVYATGETYSANEMLIKLDQQGNGELTDKYLNFIYQAYKDIEGKIEGIFFFAIDVTEQVLSRKKIEDSENRFRVIIEKSAEMMTLTTEAGIVLYASPSIAKIFGYQLEELNHVSVFDFIHPDDIKKFIQGREKILKTEGSSFNSQLQVRHKNGSWFWCEATLTNMLHEPGVNALVSNFRDISDKKKAERQQEFDNNNLHALINNTHDLMWSIDKDFKLVTFNQPFFEIIASVSGKKLKKGDDIFSVVLSPEQLNRFEISYSRALSGEIFTEIEYISNIDSWSEISYYPIRKGDEVIGTACHSRDITERKRSEEKLVQSEKNYREIVETAQEGIWMIDENNKTTFVNKKMCEMLEYTEAEMIGRTNLSFKDAEEQKRTLAQIERRKKGLKDSHESTFVTKTGRNIYTQVSTNPIVDAEGGYKGALAMMSDITERKLAEIQMKELNENLERQTRKLAMSNEELERFAYVTSHDLQEPLRMVTSFLQLLQKKYDNKLDDTAQKYINFAVDGAARMKILILDLLEFSRISSVVEDHTIINLNDVITKVRHLLKPAIDESNAHINVPFLPKVCGNESQLLQLFQNLISNAIKYKDGLQPIINITYSETPDEWQFCIADNGIGIDEKFFEKIFIIFQRLHNKNEYAGTGIGLAICKKIVELHGGKIWVESVKGEGSKFYFTIQKLQRSDDNDAHILCPDIITNT